MYNKMEKEHLEWLNNAFACLSNAGLKIKLNKCSVFKEQIHYLGRLVSDTSTHRQNQNPNEIETSDQYQRS